MAGQVTYLFCHMTMGSASRSLMSTNFLFSSTSGCGVSTSQPTWENRKPRRASCGSASVSLYLWCTRWSRAHWYTWRCEQRQAWQLEKATECTGTVSDFLCQHADTRGAANRRVHLPGLRPWRVWRVEAAAATSPCTRDATTVCAPLPWSRSPMRTPQRKLKCEKKKGLLFYCSIKGADEPALDAGKKSTASHEGRNARLKPSSCPPTNPEPQRPLFLFPGRNEQHGLQTYKPTKKFCSRRTRADLR